ncbi:suppressor of cytokine signaling [Chamberlinius hualienensis]
MPASLSLAQPIGTSVHHQITETNTTDIVSSVNQLNLDLFNSLIWPQIDGGLNSVSKNISEKETGGVHLTFQPLMSGVHIYPYPQRRGIQTEGVCNVTISTSWVIKNVVNDFNSDEDDFHTLKREVRQFAKNLKPDPLEVEFQCLRTCVMKLESSGWYYGQLSWKEATVLLEKTPVGTFLVRDSSDPAYLFALSIQTECGPTSIRIHYADGQFKLDAEDLIAGNLPVFDCVVKLVNYYIDLSKENKLSGTNHVWLDETGRRDRVILINSPLYNEVRSLQHLCRLTVNKHVPLQRIHELQLPKAMITFLNSYRYLR